MLLLLIQSTFYIDESDGLFIILVKSCVDLLRCEELSYPKVSYQNMQANIQQIKASETWQIRLDVLRPNKSLADVQFPHNNEPNGKHYGAFQSGQLVGIASIHYEPYPKAPALSAWRLRGMATLPEVRGQGYGKALLLACFEYLCEINESRLWCNARTSAVNFYSSLGFIVDSTEFEISDAGPHVLMYKNFEKS